MELLIENAGRSTFLVYKMRENDELDSIGLGMIENNSISGILPIALNHYDDDRRLSFNISSQISLTKLLMGKISRKKILTIFISICDAFLEAEDYLLEEGYFLLDKDYIYTNASNGAANLIYFPILRDCEPVDLPAFFKELIFSIQSDPDENCDYVAKIISFLNSKEGFDLVKFREMIYSLRQADGNENRHYNNSGHRNSVSSSAVNSVDNRQKEPLETSDGQKNSDNGEHNFDFVYPDSDIEKTFYENKSSSDIGNQKEKKSLFGGLFKKKTVKTEKKPIFGKKTEVVEEEIPSFEFAIPGEAAFELPNNNEIDKKTKSENNKSDEKPQSFDQGVNRLSQQQAINHSSKISGHPIKPNDNTSSEGYTIIGGVDLGGGRSDKTELDVPGTGNKSKEDDVYAPATLLRVSNNERKLISGNMLRIGRQRDAVDFYVSGNKSVSHVHADIIKKNDKYYICDMNSKNHTYLNGMELVSGREYQLHTNDRIRLSNEEFVFSE